MQREMDKKAEKHIALRIFFWEIFCFCLIFILGLLSAAKIQKFTYQEGIVLPSISLEAFLVYFLLATLIILLIVYLPKIKRARGIIYKLLFVFSSVYGCLIVLSSFLPDIATLIIIGLLIYCWHRFSNLLFHNLLMILGMAGLAAVMGLSLKPEIVMVILTILSVYDFIAVYKTKHMIKMAGSMMESGVIMGLILPQKISDFWEKTKNVQPGGRLIVLGGGDVVFPLLLAISLIPKGIINSLIVAGFAFLGTILSFTLFIFQKKREPIPALPPIALLSIIGYLITLLI